MNAHYKTKTKLNHKRKKSWKFALLSWIVLAPLSAPPVSAETVALWLFDEQQATYPSSPLNDAGPHSRFVILGRGATLVDGRFGNALQPREPEPLNPVFDWNEEQQKTFGLVQLPTPPGRTHPPMTWKSARFAAFFTSGDTHLRRLPFENASDTNLNLGAFDWTVEFWFQSKEEPGGEKGVVFEIGNGPRGEPENMATRLMLSRNRNSFVLENEFTGLSLEINSSDRALRSGNWHHYAFTYHAKTEKLRHFVDGKPINQAYHAEMQALPFGDEAYFSIGRDGLWNRPLPGALDEMRFSDHLVYKDKDEFEVPGSFSRRFSEDRPETELVAGPPLLFPHDRKPERPVQLGSRRHLFIDDALVDSRENITFQANPARLEEVVIDGIQGWLTVLEDDKGFIRLYYEGPDNSLAVMMSVDGIHFTKPDLGREYKGARNVVLEEPSSRGNVFIDPSAPPEERWKIVSAIRKRGGVYVYTSPDGFNFKRNEVAALPFWAGSQSVVFYDDQRQLYVGHHRTDYGKTPAGKTKRYFVLTEVRDILAPWEMEPATPESTAELAKRIPIKNDLLDPWYLDNGPLAPGGFGMEFPIIFGAKEGFDPLATDVYNSRGMKYPYAPDTYLAFPLYYFHYWGDGPVNRQVLGHPDRELGSGLVEVQLATSRNGREWTRYPRPTYIGVGPHKGYPANRPYIAYGFVKRGREFYHYTYTRSSYHDGFTEPEPPVIHRATQRIDGFVSIDTPYTGGGFTTKPLVFEGDRLVLNIDTDATGYAQVEIQDEDGHPIPGYSLKDAVYINGDFINKEVEWLDKGTDLSALEGRTIRLRFVMRGSRLYAMEFTSEKGRARRPATEIYEPENFILDQG